MATERPGYLPALDGVRGLAVVAVLAFHFGVPGTGGGFVGVSLFFTLSGFLITRLLVAELGETGRLALGAFWGRRARRLLPAAMLVAFGVVAAAAAGLVTVSPEMRLDLLGAVSQTANWRFWASGRSYASLFAAPSPFLHFWSLAVEEQLYIVIPLVIALVARRARLRPQRFRRIPFVLAALWAASVASSLVLATAGKGDLVYYATFTRAAEVLAGAVVAALPLAGVWPMPRRVARFVGPISLATIGAAIVFVARDDRVVSHGLFPVLSIVSALLVAALVGGSPLTTVLSWAPLRQVGVVSYALYLVHWPLVVAFTPVTTGLDGLPLFAARLLVTVGLAALCHVAVERPLRSSVALRGWLGAAALAMTAAVFAVAVVPARAWQTPQAAEHDFAAVQHDLKELAASATPGPMSSVVAAAEPSNDLPSEAVAASAKPAALPLAPALSAPARLGFFGDSTALMTAYGIGVWAGSSHEFVVAGGVASLGCSLARDGVLLNGFREAEPVRPSCASWPTTWPTEMRDKAIDVAVVQIGPWDVTDRELLGDTSWRRPGDPAYDAELSAEVGEAMDSLTAAGGRVVWLTSPVVQMQGHPSSEPARIERLNSIIRAEASTRHSVRVVDLAGYLRGLPGGELDTRLRPDGVHFTRETATEVATTWLGAQIVAAST
jgi:peptidoglycan/LPS O-acetylase OafA/YrhL